MLKKIKKKLSNNIRNIRGWNTKKKILVIDSDDWGTIRMPSKEVYSYLLKKGVSVDKCPFSMNDSLASEEDLTELFNVLLKFKDHKGNPPCVNANSIMANPDFEKIKNSDYKEYYYENFTKTLKSYPNHSNSFNLWKKGIEMGVFRPEYHGREHLNVSRWLERLQKKETNVLLAFEEKMFGLNLNVLNSPKMSLMAALDIDDKKDIDFIERSLISGLEIFYNSFTYKPTSFIAPNYTWDSNVEKILATKDIKYIQTLTNQIKPRLSDQNKLKHYIGDKNEFDQTYIVRNCIFEPSTTTNIDDVDRCLKEIEIAYRWNKPAVVSTHRLNYIGTISRSNREKNLKLLEELLKRVLIKWPDVEFMSSSELGHTISDGR